MRKATAIIFILIIFCDNSKAQHNLSVTGGWTCSSLYKVGSKEAFEISYYYADLFRFTPFNTPNLNLKYDYIHPAFRLSTGFSLLSLGAHDFFWKGTEWAHMYLTIPVLFGHQFKFSNEYSLVIEGGVEAGTSIMNVGSTVILGREHSRPYIGVVIGLEGKYKCFILGIRGHLGLNNFDWYEFYSEKQTLYFRHIGGTLYLGYTFWDSQKAKARRARKRATTE